MEVKKTNKANLENKKVLFLEIGLAVTLVIAIVAFEYRSFDKGDEGPDIKRDSGITEVIDIPITDNTPPPPPEEIPPADPTEFEIVDPSVIIDKQFNLEDIFKDINTGVGIGKREIPDDDGKLEDDDVLFTVVETQAELPFPNGFDGYLSKSIVYPEAARQAGIEGQVSVEFVIEKDGSVTNIKILRDIGGGCGEELVRVLKAMPKWKPALQRGKPVRNQFGKNVRFGLSGS